MAFVCKLQSCGTALLSSENCRLPQRGVGILCNAASIITYVIVSLYTCPAGQDTDVEREALAWLSDNSV